MRVEQNLELEILMKLLFTVLVLIAMATWLIREGWQSIKHKSFEEVNEDTDTRKVYFGKKAIFYEVVVLLGGMWCLYQATYFIFEYLTRV